MPTNIPLQPIDNSTRIQEELELASEKYHIWGAWIAIFADPLFAVTDYINIPNDWKGLLAIRLSVSLITFLVLYFRKSFKIKSNTIIIFVPFVLISLQNAYTFSLISDEHILGHCLNYIALLIGAGMFVLWSWKLSATTVSLSAIATGVFVSVNPDISTNNFLLHGGLLLAVVSAFMILLIQTRYSLTIKEIKSRLQVEKVNKELVIQKDLVDERNHQITSSIRYAQRIQHAILGNSNALSEYFEESFVLFQPKDILSGDFYWFYENKADNTKVIVAADCTGHGVPGALTTVLGCAILNDIVVQKNIYSPDLILQELDKTIIKSFSTEKNNETKISDGMDISILTFQEDEVFFSAAKNPLYHIRDKEVFVTKGSRASIGHNHLQKDKTFEKHKIDVQKGDKLYIFSDGYQDQIGQEVNKKYYTKRFREFLTETSSVSLTEQYYLLKNDFNDWKKDLPQTDDVLVIGIEV